MKRFLILVIVLFAAMIMFKTDVYAYEDDDDEIIEESTEDDYNLVCYDYELDEITYLKFNDSLASAEHNPITVNGISPASIIGEANFEQINNTTVEPYKYICSFDTYGGTAFFVGPNILLAAGHSVYDGSTVGFKKNHNTVTPARSNDLKPYGEYSVKKAYINKACYTSTVATYDNDWAILVIEDSYHLSQQINGYFDMLLEYNYLNSQITIIGYPSDYSGNFHMYSSTGNILSYTSERIYHNADNVGGMSGGPMIVTHNNKQYVIGVEVHGDIGMGNGSKRINPFIYYLVKAIRSQKNKVEVKNYYFENETYIQYNCVVKLIINATSSEIIRLYNRDNSNYTLYNEFKEEYYTTKNETNVGDIPYNSFYNYKDGVLSSSSTIDYSYTEAERSALYRTMGSLTNGDVLFNNTWNAYNCSSSNIVKGTIVYNGEAKNVECQILGQSFNYSTVNIDDVAFIVSANTSTVRIFSSEEIICDTNNLFAFCII